MTLGESKKTIGLELSGKHQLFVYVHDVNMLGENLQTIRENTELFIKASKDIGLEVNVAMVTPPKECNTKSKYIIGNLLIENVEKFKYLGVRVTNPNDNSEEIKRRLNMGNACYYSLEKILSSRLISKNLKVNTYKNIILPVV